MATNIARATAVIDALRDKVSTSEEKLHIADQFCAHVGLPALQGVFPGITAIEDLTAEQKSAVFVALMTRLAKRVMASAAGRNIREAAELAAVAQEAAAETTLD